MVGLLSVDIVGLLSGGVVCVAVGLAVGFVLGSEWEAKRWRRMWELQQKPAIVAKVVDESDELPNSSFSVEDAARVRRRVEEARKRSAERRRTL